MALVVLHVGLPRVVFAELPDPPDSSSIRVVREPLVPPRPAPAISPRPAPPPAAASTKAASPPGSTEAPVSSAPAAASDGPGSASELQLARGQRQRLAGILFTLVGAGLLGGGGAALSACCNTPNPLPSASADVKKLVEDSNKKTLTAGVLLGTGFVTLVTGIILWGVGQSNVNDGHKSSSLTLVPAPLGSGVGWRF